ncbi:hypothetical protein [Candidatus Synchoanobacter obligatus]|uniref:EF-hand domain-containing protein n=1 Tax=Candidatus Synchoanobacter obligatus TaxID=2919597 RepID=A0ABT1L3V0_9GAMM|nr:hypothetical protein [Candidatus Synchoanobacter obligatus]MCP8351877.1 hypothetical protein [Candidatus Synchoanobacter obligatus]
MQNATQNAIIGAFEKAGATGLVKAAEICQTSSKDKVGPECAKLITKRINQAATVFKSKGGKATAHQDQMKFNANLKLERNAMGCVTGDDREALAKSLSTATLKNSKKLYKAMTPQVVASFNKRMNGIVSVNANDIMGKGKSTDIAAGALTFMSDVRLLDSLKVFNELTGNSDQAQKAVRGTFASGNIKARMTVMHKLFDKIADINDQNNDLASQLANTLSGMLVEERGSFGKVSGQLEVTAETYGPQSLLMDLYKGSTGDDVIKKHQAGASVVVNKLAGLVNQHREQETIKEDQRDACIERINNNNNGFVHREEMIQNLYRVVERLGELKDQSELNHSQAMGAVQAFLEGTELSSLDLRSKLRDLATDAAPGPHSSGRLLRTTPTAGSLERTAQAAVKVQETNRAKKRRVSPQTSSSPVPKSPGRASSNAS